MRPIFKIYLDKLNKLEEMESKSKLNIINIFLVIELLSISFTTAVLLLKNEIKFEQVKEYLKFASHFYNNKLKINPNTVSLLVEMSVEEKQKFSNLLKEENDIVNKYVIRLNNVFLIKYENDLWERFNSLYDIEKQYFNSHKKFQKWNQKLEKVLTNIITEKNFNNIHQWDVKKEINPLYHQKNITNEKK
ncbi:hypothetical protein [Spiroplasma endosymbiont of Ammophila pubescens]|uniref:hypothetical protein n=1 Tax=Spiroplasma endosymbiont of Ammophila pubescens TaxID=3066315 RepID=UPI0032B207FC